MLLSPDALTVRARNVRLVLLDVDGVLTDGTVAVHGSGTEAKNFSIRDGAAVVWAQRNGLQVGFLSGRPSPATARRAAELGVSLVVQGDTNKGAAYSNILSSHTLTDDQVAYMGDDLLDLPVLKRVGLATAPADAVDEVRSRVHWVSRHGGGRGAVRELIELVARARGQWDPFVESFLT
jgi:3-deoxy-D-manno-octulosonate 8-phosphate phosphatase (KDO 8-P phosphatase)